MRKISNKEEENKVKKKLKEWWNKMPDQVKLYPYCQPCYAGVADYIGSVNGRAVMVEVKKEGGKKEMRPTQKLQKKKWEQTSGLFFLVDSLEDCKLQFKETGLIK